VARHLTKADVAVIVELIDGWSEDKFTWDLLCEACEPIVGKRPVRQSLQAHGHIKDAYTAKKKGLKNGVRKPLPANLKAAAERISNLESKVLRLTLANNALMEQFVVWQYNAYKYGVTEERLNAPLPVIDRERTEE
jgi:hypothetical protein